MCSFQSLLFNKYEGQNSQSAYHLFLGVIEFSSSCKRGEKDIKPRGQTQLLFFFWTLHWFQYEPEK